MKQKLVTIVTGGGRGIGRAIAIRMARLTAILVVGRTQSDLEAVCDEIRSRGGDADYCIGDVANEATAAAALAKVQEHNWLISNLVCNAGIAKGGPIVTFSPEIWRRMFDVNVHGTFHFIRACLPAMIERKQGTISIISSTLGLKGHKNDTAYSATKSALINLAQSLAEEVRKHNIMVVPLCPGFVETEMTRRTVAGLMTHRQISQTDAEKLIAAANPQGRILQAEEVAEAVAFCSTTTEHDMSGKPMDLTGHSEPRVLQLINWVRENAAPAKKLLIPISGGSDSALTFYACTKAYPDKVLGIFVGKPKELRSREWFESIGQVSYEPDVRGARGASGIRGARGARDARAAPGGGGAHPHRGNAEIWRWSRFLELSNATGAWLVGSRNHTEEFTGLYSLASRVATFLPLASIWKSEVMALCDSIGVPSEVTASSRRADPDCGRPQELAEIELEKIDIYLQVCSGELPETALEVMTTAQLAYLGQLVEQNQFKRFLPARGPALLHATKSQ